MSHADVNRVGPAGEAAVAAELTEAGFHVFLPAFGAPEIDMIVELNNKLLRLQVKTQAGKSPSLRYATYGPDSVGYEGKVDWLALHSLHYGITAFLKPEEVGKYPTLRYDSEEDHRKG